MMRKEEFKRLLEAMLKPGTNDQSQSDFCYHADDMLRMWDGYDHPKLAEQTKLMEKLPNENYRQSANYSGRNGSDHHRAQVVAAEHQGL